MGVILFLSVQRFASAGARRTLEEPHDTRSRGLLLSQRRFTADVAALLAGWSSLIGGSP